MVITTRKTSLQKTAPTPESPNGVAKLGAITTGATKTTTGFRRTTTTVTETTTAPTVPEEANQTGGEDKTDKGKWRYQYRPTSS